MLRGFRAGWSCGGQSVFLVEEEQARAAKPSSRLWVVEFSACWTNRGGYFRHTPCHSPTPDREPRLRIRHLAPGLGEGPLHEGPPDTAYTPGLHYKIPVFSDPAPGKS